LKFRNEFQPLFLSLACVANSSLSNWRFATILVSLSSKNHFNLKTLWEILQNGSVVV
jgi:hypothetical protein